MRKQLADAHTCAHSYKFAKHVSEYANRLISKLEKKLSMIKELGMLTYHIETLGKKGTRSVISSSLFSQSGSSTYKVLSRDDSPGSPNIRIQKLSASPFIGISPQNSEKDLLKIALKNCANASQKRSTMSPSKSTFDIEKIEGSQSSEKEESTPNSFSLSPANLLPVSTLTSDDSFYLYMRKTLSQSLTLPHRKPFDKTENEEMMEAIFKGYVKPKKANRSLDMDLLYKRNVQADERLNTSCTLEYSTAHSYNKQTKQMRHNSEILIQRTKYSFEEEATKSKA